MSNFRLQLPIIVNKKQTVLLKTIIKKTLLVLPLFVLGTYPFASPNFMVLLIKTLFILLPRPLPNPHFDFRFSASI